MKPAARFKLSGTVRPASGTTGASDDVVVLVTGMRLLVVGSVVATPTSVEPETTDVVGADVARVVDVLPGLEVDEAMGSDDESAGVDVWFWVREESAIAPPATSSRDTPGTTARVATRRARRRRIARTTADQSPRSSPEFGDDATACWSSSRRGSRLSGSNGSVI
jgi:hypothetical protein